MQKKDLIKLISIILIIVWTIMFINYIFHDTQEEIDSVQQKIEELNKQIYNQEIQLISYSKIYSYELSEYNRMKLLTDNKSWVVAKAYQVYIDADKLLNKLYNTKKELLSVFKYGK